MGHHLIDDRALALQVYLLLLLDPSYDVLFLALTSHLHWHSPWGKTIATFCLDVCVALLFICSKLANKLAKTKRVTTGDLGWAAAALVCFIKSYQIGRHENGRQLFYHSMFRIACVMLLYTR